MLPNTVYHLMFVDSCIIVKFMQKNPTRCNSVSKFIIPYLYEAQHVSGRHTARHQEPKIALAASGFAYVKGCWTLRLLEADSVQQPRVQQPSTYAKPNAASVVLGS